MEMDIIINMQLKEKDRLFAFNKYFRYILPVCNPDIQNIKIVGYINELKRSILINEFNRENIIKIITSPNVRSILQPSKFHIILINSMHILIYCKTYNNTVYIPFYYDREPYYYNIENINTIKYVSFCSFSRDIENTDEADPNRICYFLNPDILPNSSFVKSNIIYIENGRSALTFAIAFCNKYGHSFPPELFEMINNDYILYIPLV